MFKNPLSLKGRIRRTEFGISFLIYWIISVLVSKFLDIEDVVDLLICLLIIIPTLWFFWAQGAKRCHDIGREGWWIVVPFFMIWLLFVEGDRKKNAYGLNPKEPITPDWDPSMEKDIVE